MEAEEVVMGRIQLCGFNQLKGRECTPNPGSEFTRLRMTLRRVCSETLSPIQHAVPGDAHQDREVVQEMSPDDPVADPGRLAASRLWCVLISRPGRGPLGSRLGLEMQGAFLGQAHLG